MTKTARPYQTQAIDAACEELDAGRSTVIVMATGLGKSFCFAKIIARYVKQGRVLVIADRVELLEQAMDEIEPLVGYRPDLEQGDNYASDGILKKPIVCSMIQSQRSGSSVKRWHRFDPNEFALVVTDEVDLAASDSYREMYAHYRQNPKLKMLGVTATYERHDGKQYTDLFETVAFDFPIQDAIREAWLVPVVQRYVETPIDLSGVSITLGELNATELRETLAKDNTLERIASDVIQYAGTRQTLVFADSVPNAETLTVAFNRHNIGSARIITGETEKEFQRPQLFADYKANLFQYLVNVGVVTRGVDVPGIQCIALAAPTASINKQTQQLGRGTRTWPGLLDELGNATIDERSQAIAHSPKPDCLVLDLIKNYARKKLPTVADVIGVNYDDDVVELADKMARESGKPVDVTELLETAQRKHNDEILEEARRKEALQLRKKSASRDVDPFGLYGIDRRAARGWEHDSPMTATQRSKLEKWKIKGMSGLTESEAEQIAAEVRRRARLGLLTLNQAATLKRYHYQTQNMTYEQAHSLLDQIAANGWRPLRKQVTA